MFSLSPIIDRLFKSNPATTIPSPSTIPESQRNDADASGNSYQSVRASALTVQSPRSSFLVEDYDSVSWFRSIRVCALQLVQSNLDCLEITAKHKPIYWNDSYKVYEIPNVPDGRSDSE